MASERRQPVQMAQSLQKEVIQTAFDDEQSLESKTDQHQVNKIDSDTAGSKQEKCDEISNEMKSMLIKICWTKGFFKKKKNTQPAEAVVPTKCSQNSAARRAGVSVFTHSNDRESRIVVIHETRTRAEGRNHVDLVWTATRP